MTNKDSGNQGEDAVSGYLTLHGYQIVDRNWKTRWCEIDIIAQKAGCIYFVESKRRLNSSFGDGLDYITKKKLSQMKFAAEFWLSKHDWRGECCLAAAGVSNTDSVEFVVVSET